MPDQVASLLPSGAGRFQDFIWPDPLQMLGGGVSASFRSRVGGGAEMPGAVVTFAAGAAAIVNVFAGMPLVFIPCDVANAGSQRLFYPGFPVTLRTSRTPIDGGTDDCAAYRFVIVMGISTGMAAGGELGFQLTQYNGGGGQRLVGDVSPGIAINIRKFGTTNVEVLIRGPNGLISQELVGVGAPFMSTFDLRFFSATATVDAFWTLRVNGAVMPLLDVNSNWGAVGTNLPPAAMSGASMGFVPSIVSSAQNNNGIGVQSLELIAAPSELMTL